MKENLKITIFLILIVIVFFGIDITLRAYTIKKSIKESFKEFELK